MEGKGGTWVALQLQTFMCIRITQGILSNAGYDAIGLAYGLRFCVSNKFTDDTIAAGPGTTLRSYSTVPLELESSQRQSTNE